MTYLNREFRVLTEQQLQRVHALTLEVLERKGILFHSEEARGILEAHGARVDGECVRLSPSQVDDAPVSWGGHFRVMPFPVAGG